MAAVNFEIYKFKLQIALEIQFFDAQKMIHNVIRTSVTHSTTSCGSLFHRPQVWVKAMLITLPDHQTPQWGAERTGHLKILKNRVYETEFQSISYISAVEIYSMRLRLYSVCVWLGIWTQMRGIFTTVVGRRVSEFKCGSDPREAGHLGSMFFVLTSYDAVMSSVHLQLNRQYSIMKYIYMYFVNSWYLFANYVIKNHKCIFKFTRSLVI